MVNPILDAKNECRALVAAALAAAMADGSLPEAEAPEFNVEIPGDTSHGDLSTNAAMVSARAFRKAPRMIADAITSHIDLDGSSFEKVEVAAPALSTSSSAGSGSRTASSRSCGKGRITAAPVSAKGKRCW